MLTPLPEGWFTNENIQTYRRLVSLVPEGGCIAELGNWIGRSLCAVSDIIREKKIKVVAVDTFAGTEQEDFNSVDYAKKVDIHAMFVDNIRTHGIEKSVEIFRMPTHEAVNRFESQTFDLIFVDADHRYESVKKDIEDWLPKVKDGGYFAGHDYDKDHTGVINAVTEIFGDKAAIENGVWIHKKGEGAIVVHSRPHLPVSCVIPTKDRLMTTLPIAITSIANQTRPPENLFIMDDGEPHDPRSNPLYDQLFKMLTDKGIQWFFLFGERKGLAVQHTNSLKIVRNELVWRVDDDDMPECNVLETLYASCTPDVGAVGSSVLFPNMYVNPGQCSSMLPDIYEKPNLQWSRFKGIREVDHLNNTFLYRKSAIRGYPEQLSPVSHREDTIWSYGCKLNGYKVLVNGDCITWHLRQATGGIRAYNQQEMYDNDEKIFQRFLEANKSAPTKPKMVVLDNGIGDHLMFKQILPEIREKFPGQRILIAACYPEVFEGEDVEIISLAHAQSMGENIKKHDIYQYCIDNNWQGSLIDAFRKIYL